MTGLASFGADEITFTSFAATPATRQRDALGTYSPLPVTPATTGPAGVVPGCRHRPFREATRGGAGAAKAEYPEAGVGIGTNWWQSTCPPHPAAVAARSSDVITVGGVDYRILGDARPFTEKGRIVKITFLSERQTPIT